MKPSRKRSDRGPLLKAGLLAEFAEEYRNAKEAGDTWAHYQTGISFGTYLPIGPLIERWEAEPETVEEVLRQINREAERTWTYRRGI